MLSDEEAKKIWRDYRYYKMGSNSVVDRIINLLKDRAERIRDKEAVIAQLDEWAADYRDKWLSYLSSCERQKVAQAWYEATRKALTLIRNPQEATSTPSEVPK